MAKHSYPTLPFPFQEPQYGQMGWNENMIPGATSNFSDTPLGESDWWSSTPGSAFKDINPMGGLPSGIDTPGGKWDWFTGGTNKDGSKFNGAGGLMLGGASALSNMYLGMKQYGLAKDSLKFNKESFAKNYEASKRTTNAAMRERREGLIASNPSAYESIDEYMRKNEVT